MFESYNFTSKYTEAISQLEVVCDKDCLASTNATIKAMEHYASLDGVVTATPNYFTARNVKSLNFCEVRVVTEDDKLHGGGLSTPKLSEKLYFTEGVAASMSEASYNRTAAMAIDGNRTGVFDSEPPTCIFTETEEPWWKLRLPESYGIPKEIQIYHRTDENYKSRSKAEVKPALLLLMLLM